MRKRAIKTRVLGLIRRGFLGDSVIIAFPLLMLTRALQVDSNFGGLTDCYSCFFWAALQSDISLFVLLLLFYGAVLLTPVLALRLLLKLAMLSLLLLYVVDLVLLDLMAIRLNFSEAIKYAFAVGPIYDIAKAYISESNPWLLLSTVSGVVLVSVFLIAPVSLERWRTNTLLLMLPALALAAWLPSNVGYVHSWGYENVLRVNLSSGVTEPYSAPFIEALEQRNRDRPLLQCNKTDGTGAGRNVVLVILESFSAYHSRFFSGLNDLTPQMDRIARENRALTNFHANGFTTEAGLLALLTGRISLPVVEENSLGAGVSFKGGFNLDHTLPKMLSNEGYFSAFLTSGDLGFLDKGKWLKSIGFDHVEGHQHPFYRPWPRFHFQAAPDRALYLRSLQAIEKLETRPRPFFLTVETVSTHLPFINPETGIKTEAAAVSYADKALGEFYDRIVKSGFFKRGGMLLIVSDHRSMTPIKSAELERFGERAESLVPMIIVDPLQNFTGEDDALGQQTDLVGSLQSQVAGVSCQGRFQSDLFDPSSNADCVFHSSGVVRDRVSVLCHGEPEQVVILNGDDTGFEGSAPPQALRILDYINGERVRRLSGRYDSP
ncbi:LTA synthase family protein [Aestuariirhabdus sp. LZHN29]|uniref:LTA synthase family protein n=1 Tax=Aestuariirhabdus sp. LZHN29 TaxID=3417462 RepID=UPI003CF7393F